MIFGFFLFFLLVLAFFIGRESGFLHFRRFLDFRNCRLGMLPPGEYDEVDSSDYMSRTMRALYSDEYTYERQYIPKGISLKDYYPTLNKGGFYYFKTSDGRTVACGLYK